MTKDDILNQIRVSYTNILGDNLVGIYVHGSIAFGCYDPCVSDIDFLVVVEDTPTLADKQAMIEVILKLEPYCPAKGLEMSVVLARVCSSFVYPTPYELHYSIAHSARAHQDLIEYCTNFYGTDKDLAAHFTVIRAVGMVLCGKPIQGVFGDVPCKDYLDSLREDVKNAAEDIFENPVYIILNLCRVTAYLQEGLVISKKDGGEWGILHLPERYHSLIRAALAAYTDHVPYVSNEALQRSFATELCAAIL